MTTIGSVCSGVGALDLAVTQLLPGSRIAWHAETNPDASRVLAHHWPGVPNHGDFTRIDWYAIEPVDVLIGGYPCQPFSPAGLRKGHHDHRHLWPHVAGAVRCLQPRLVLLENVRAHVSLGLDAVVRDLAHAGYDAAWRCVRASDAGAPHGRERLFLAAAPADTAGGRDWPYPDGVRGDAPVDGRRGTGDDHVPGRPRPEWDGPAAAWLPAVERWEPIVGRRAPRPVEPAPRGGSRTSMRLVEWMMGLPDGWVTGVPGVAYGAQEKALGNAVVPQQALAAYRGALADLAVPVGALVS